LLVVIGLGWMFDAMDTGLISFILAKMAEDWQMTADQKSWVVSIGFVGMAIGAICSGGLADRFGRKTVFAATLVIYSLATAACAFAPDLTWLLVFRFIVGLGLGGQLPVAVTLVSEYIPAHVRGRFIVLLESFWGLGWLCAALISYFGRGASIALYHSRFWLANRFHDWWPACAVCHRDLENGAGIYSFPD